MKTRHDHKNIVITGGSHGLGKAMALRFAKKKHNILFTYCSDEKAAIKTMDEIRQYGVNVKAIQIDLSKDEDIDRLIKESYEFFDDVDVLINNAGIISRAPLLEVTREETEKVFKVNALAPFFLLQAFGKRMQEKQLQRIQDAYQQYGVEQTNEMLDSSKKLEILSDYCMIFITSISRKVFTGLPAYEASKEAAHDFAQIAAADPVFGRLHIRVNSIAPGLIATNLNHSVRKNQPTLWKERSHGISLGYTGDAENVAYAASSIIKNPWMTGSEIIVDGGRTPNRLGSEMYTKGVDGVAKLQSKLG